MSRNGVTFGPKMNQNLPLEFKGVQRGFGDAKRLSKIIFYASFWRSFWHVLGYSEAGLFGPRLLELPRAALELPGEPQEPFRLHFGCIFGAILGPVRRLIVVFGRGVLNLCVGIVAVFFRAWLARTVETHCC